MNVDKIWGMNMNRIRVEGYLIVNSKEINWRVSMEVYCVYDFRVFGL